jgi:hypothetical protein
LTFSSSQSSPCKFHLLVSSFATFFFFFTPNTTITHHHPSLSSQVIKGWTEAMQLMKEGDKWELYIPSVSQRVLSVYTHV